MATNDVYAEIRLWLADRIKGKGISQAELARSMNLPPSAISRILKGERQISISELIEAGIILDSSLYEIDALFSDIKKQSGKQFWNRGVAESKVSIPELYQDDKARYPDEQLTAIGSYSDRASEWIIPKFVFGNRIVDAVTAKWFFVDDDAMAPTISQGDTVFLGFGVVNPLKNGVYAIEGSKNELILRRLEFFLAEGQVRTKVVCDNPAFDDTEAPLNEVRIAAHCIAHFSILVR